MPFENITQQDHKIGIFCLDLGHAGRQPVFVYLGPQVKIRQTNDNGSIHFMGQVGKAHLIIFHYGWTQALK